MSNNNELKNTRFCAKSTGEECDIPSLKNKTTQLSDVVCVNGIYYGENENVTNNNKTPKKKYSISAESAFVMGFFIGGILGMIILILVQKGIL